MSHSSSRPGDPPFKRASWVQVPDATPSPTLMDLRRSATNRTVWGSIPLVGTWGDLLDQPSARPPPKAGTGREAVKGLTGRRDAQACRWRQRAAAFHKRGSVRAALTAGTKNRSAAHLRVRRTAGSREKRGSGADARWVARG